MKELRVNANGEPDPHGSFDIPIPDDSIAWSDVSPNAPGWFWYEDEYYGLAPLYLDWMGFRNVPDARTLVVDMCVGEDQELIAMHIGELHGKWYPLAEPPEQ